MPNRLAHSTSPYLQQHAGNPVDWHEWGPEALAEARARDKPILLSVGYSACHWCHVMAHESFEDENIAALMNRLFVNIKVDREERPDIDQIYQMAHALMTQRSGGWPLTMFLTPDATPFFGGTYYPNTARHGLPAFGDVLVRIAQAYREHPDDIRAQNESLLEALRHAESGPAQAANAMPVAAAAIGAARDAIVSSFDARRGGFGRAPKFPHPEMLEFCLRRYAEAGDEETRHVACFTLEQMCLGGIFDQLGGGFARYSTDADWAIPHFEKMLYDNGPLLRLLADAYLVAENDAQKRLFARCAEQTAAWVMREMQSPAGGYYSTLDADSEGHEGRFYVWDRAEVEQVLSGDELRIAQKVFGLDRPQNFEGASWNLIRAMPVEQAAQELGLPPGSGEQLQSGAARKLLAARERRVRPGRDEKILTSWNALMIEGMAHAGRVFDRRDWIDSARRALDFVRTTMWDESSQRLRATHKDGITHLNAYLDDYAYLVKAIVALAQADFRADELAFARAVADVLIAQFEDRERGGFFFTSHDHEQLIQRPKPGFDNAMPSGNGIAAFALQRLSHVIDAPGYASAAERTLRFFGPALAQHPSGHCSLLMALGEFDRPLTVVILTGPGADVATWQRAVAARYLPSTLTLGIANATVALPAFLARPEAPVATAYVCHGVSCLPPVTALAELVRLL